MNPVQSLQSRRWTVLAGAVGLLCVYALVHDIAPQVIDIVRMQKTIKNNENRLAQIDEWDWTIRRMVRKKEKLNLQIENLVYSQQQKNQFSSIYEFLSDNAKRKDITLLNIKLGDSETGNRYIRLPVYLRMNARFHALAGYINVLETSGPIIQIESWSISAKEMTSDELTANLVIYIYFLT